jgi:hypothetical protein
VANKAREAKLSANLSGTDLGPLLDLMKANLSGANRATPT